MGVLHGRDLLSSKWITAIISDSSHRVHFVPIKHTLGDYFITDIDGDVYAFKIDGRRILQYRESMVKTFRVIIYDVSHYLPLSSETKELELILELNSLPKADNMLASIFKILGNKERGVFAGHKLAELIDRIKHYEGSATTEQQEQYSRDAQNMINYLDHLDVTEIVTPLKKVSEFIQEDLIATDPKFMGTVVASYQRTDMEHKKVTNTPIQSKQAWIKFLAIFMGIGMVFAIGYIVYDGGFLDGAGFGDMVPTLGGISDEELMKKYPDGVSMKRAVNNGELDYNQLSSVAKSIVDSTPDSALDEMPVEADPMPEPVEPTFEEELAITDSLPVIPVVTP